MIKIALVLFSAFQCLFTISCQSQPDRSVNLKANTLMYLVTGGGVAGHYYYLNHEKRLTIKVSFNAGIINDDTAYLNRKEEWIANAIDYFVLGRDAHSYLGYEITFLDFYKHLTRTYKHKIVDSLSIKETTSLEERMMVLGHITPYDSHLEGKEDSVILQLWPRKKKSSPLPGNTDQYAGFLAVAIKDWVLDYTPTFIQVCYMTSPMGQEIDSYTYDLKSKAFLKSYRRYLHYHTWRTNDPPSR